MPRFLRRLLVLDLQRGGARAHDVLHRVVDVHRVTEAGVGIDEHGNIGARRHRARVIADFFQADQSVVRHAIEHVGELRAGEEETFETRLLRHARVERAETARHDGEFVALQKMTEGATLFTHRIMLVDRHCFSLDESPVAMSSVWLDKRLGNNKNTD